MKRVVYIGHGRSSLWKELVPLLRMKGFEHDEFNASPPAGQTAVQRLERMLHRASYALLILTAEDEHEDGSLHPRGNVIHEAGLFQGRLGFERAVMLVEEGCSTFSNIAGLQTIRFSVGNIRSAFVEIRRLLEHWVDSSPDHVETPIRLPQTSVLQRGTSKGRFSVMRLLCAFGLTAAILAFANTQLSRLGRPWQFVSWIPTLFAAFAYSTWLTARCVEIARSVRVRADYRQGRRGFTEMQLTRAALGGLNLSGSDFTGSILYRAVLNRTNLAHAQFRDADLREAQMERVTAERADLTRATLNAAYLPEAYLAHAKAEEAEFIEAYLSKAIFASARLRRAKLQSAKLYQADLRGADLGEADLRNVVLCGADLRDAQLRDADLRRADLSGADLRGASLGDADLRRANLSGADLRGTDLGGADLEDAVLEGVQTDAIPP